MGLGYLPILLPCSPENLGRRYNCNTPRMSLEYRVIYQNTISAILLVGEGASISQRTLCLSDCVFCGGPTLARYVGWCNLEEVLCSLESY